MKKAFVVAIAMVFLLRVWVSAERHPGTVDMHLVTNFDFSTYPACKASRNSYCIQAIRFYDADSSARLAEVTAGQGMLGPERIVVAIRVNSVPRRVYAVTVYQDGSGTSREGPPGQVSTFDAASY
jgi:hypothetical protein